MRTLDFYNKIKEEVISETGIDETALFNSNREECVDARYILVYSLCSYLTDHEISRFTGLSNACVNKIRNNFPFKENKFSVRCLYDFIKLKAKESANSILGGVKL